MVALQTVEIPGFREAVKRERVLRDRAFLGGNEIVAGVVVRQMSLRTMLYLEHAQNGFMIRYDFDDQTEVLAHAIQVLYFSTPDWKAPEVGTESFWAAVRRKRTEGRFQSRVLMQSSPAEIITEVREWLEEANVDCPKGGGEDGAYQPSYASYPAHIVDLFGAAGLRFTYDDILDMPLKRLWQHWRLAVARVYEKPLTNPSDVLATEFLAKGRA